MTYVDHYKGERKQERTTPRELFDKLHARFGFTLDGAASTNNALLSRYSSIEQYVSWASERVFCNPPWSSTASFIALAPIAEFALFLVPARVNAKWFHTALALGGAPEYFLPKPKFDGCKWNSPIDCMFIKFGYEPRRDQ